MKTPNRYHKNCGIHASSIRRCTKANLEINIQISIKQLSSKTTQHNTLILVPILFRILADSFTSHVLGTRRSMNEEFSWLCGCSKVVQFIHLSVACFIVCRFFLYSIITRIFLHGYLLFYKYIYSSSVYMCKYIRMYLKSLPRYHQRNGEWV